MIPLTVFLGSVGGGLLGVAVFAILWQVAKGDALKKQATIITLKGQLQGVEDNLADVTKKAERAEQGRKEDFDRLNKLLADVEAQNDALRKRLAERATPKTEAEDMSKLFPAEAKK